MTKIIIILSLFILMIGCKKETQKISGNLYLNYSFQVGEQLDVSHYIIQVSSDGGITYQDAVTVPGIKADTYTYTAKIDVTKYFAISSTILSRIKEVDIDGKIQYSQVSLTQK